jgi:hypothetical protein
MDEAEAYQENIQENSRQHVRAARQMPSLHRHVPQKEGAGRA